MEKIHIPASALAWAARAFFFSSFFNSLNLLMFWLESVLPALENTWEDTVLRLDPATFLTGAGAFPVPLPPWVVLFPFGAGIERVGRLLSESAEVIVACLVEERVPAMIV